MGDPVGSMAVARRKGEASMAQVGPCIGRLARGVAPEALQAAMGFPVDAAAVKRIERRHGLRMPIQKTAGGARQAA